MNQFDPSRLDAMQGPTSDRPEPAADVPAEEAIGEFSMEPAAPRNNAIYALLALVALGAGFVFFMHMKTGPKTAAANPEANTAKATITQFLADGDKNMTGMRELLKNTEQIVQQFLEYPSTNQVRLEDLKKNPFLFAADKPAADTSKEQQAALERKEREATLKAVQALKIQTILVSGASRTAMINNAMYTVGQQVDGLTVEQINPDSIVVSRGKWKFEVKIHR